MGKHHACCTFKPKYLMHYRIWKILNESTLLIVTPYGRELKTNINYVQPCTTLELIQSTWNWFLNSIETKFKIMIVTWDLMTNPNTYNMNNITTTSLPPCRKYLHESSQVNSTTHFSPTTTISRSSVSTLPVVTAILLDDDITYLNHSVDVALTNQDWHQLRPKKLGNTIPCYKFKKKNLFTKLI